MILKYLSAIWAATAPALGNHLWQSTLCLVIAGLLTLVLRKNHARARYGLWLAASVKFLIPFSLLVTLGTHLARPGALPQTQPGFFFAMEEVGQPFTPHAAQVIPPVVHSATPSILVNLLPAFLVAMWLCGFVGVLFVWYARWRRISAALRQAVPLREGREVEALRRVESLGGIRRPIDLLLSPASLEPGVFGIVRPVLVWPKGISEHLPDAHLEAIVAHEVSHVRRRDNLAAAIHMVVEALFWFHPLVWWLGARLIDERERACDEEVLQLGSGRRVYAESILKTCEFCVESPLACVTGVTGADLKKRIVRIMTERMANKLSLSTKLLLAGVGIAAVAGPVVFGLMNAPQIRAQSPAVPQWQTAAGGKMEFEVISIRKVPRNAPLLMRDEGFTPILPGGHYMDVRTHLSQMISFAYNVKNPWELVGLPDWAKSQTYSVEAKPAEGFPELPPDENREQVRIMMRAMLVDRFHLQLHTETRQKQPMFNLDLAKGGLRLKEVDPPVPPATEGHVGAAMGEPGGHIVGKKSTMAGVAATLTFFMVRPVTDHTGLKGYYDFDVRWTAPPSPDEQPAAPPHGPGLGPEGTALLISMLHDRFGLRLTNTTGPVEYWVVDHVEQPSEN
jgi:uncharacterized protein (TIGR03435 family)